MIKSLRRRFILIAMCSVGAVLILILGIINLSNYIHADKYTDTVLNILAENNGDFPLFRPPQSENMSGLGGLGITAETPFEARYFSAETDTEGNILKLNLQKIAAITPEKAEEYVNYAMAKGKSGQVDGYKFCLVDSDSGTLYIFLDCNKELATVRVFLLLSVLIGTIGLVVIFLLIVVFSRFALKPVEESYQKQKAFITNASHDIKTPLSVINAEAELLEYDTGETEFTKEIKKQVQRLVVLTDKLVMLSRMEEVQEMGYEKVNISQILEDAVASYHSAARSNKLTLISSIEENITINGKPDDLSQMFALLFDNALKYTPAGGNIKVTLKEVSSKCEITFYNDAENLKAGNHNEFFERFYRGDKSRNNIKSGHGIGLSVVKLIVESHKGKISADSDKDNSITFKITI